MLTTTGHNSRVEFCMSLDLLGCGLTQIGTLFAAPPLVNAGGAERALTVGLPSLIVVLGLAAAAFLDAFRRCALVAEAARRQADGANESAQEERKKNVDTAARLREERDGARAALDTARVRCAQLEDELRKPTRACSARDSDPAAPTYLSLSCPRVAP